MDDEDFWDWEAVMAVAEEAERAHAARQGGAGGGAVASAANAGAAARTRPRGADSGAPGGGEGPTTCMVVFDLETADLRRNQYEPYRRGFWEPDMIEVGAQVIELRSDGAEGPRARPGASFQRLCRRAEGAHPLLPKVIELTGITDELLAEEGVALASALRHFTHWAEGYSNADGCVVLCAHNAVKFDEPILRGAYASAGLEFPLGWRVWDSVPYFLSVIPLQPWRRMIGLDEVVEQFETVAPRRGREHRALGDARVLVDCILYAFRANEEGALSWEAQVGGAVAC